VVLHPDAILHDIAQVAEYFLSSPLHLVHWLCVFPSYIYMLRLVLARLNVVAADAHALDLETGSGVVFHLSLLAHVAALSICIVAVANGVHAEWRAYVRECVLAPLGD